VNEMRDMDETTSTMKIWLDDDRKEPNGWVRAYTVSQAITLLDENKVEEISLDYDLLNEVDENERGEAHVPTGSDVAKWMLIKAKSNQWSKVPYMIRIHSNTPGIEQLADIVSIVAEIERLRWGHML
jgi:hypothetical protein